MKICVVTSSFPAYPGDTVRAPFLIDAISTLRAAGHEVHVLTQGPGRNEGFDFPVTYFPWFGEKSARGSVGELLQAPLRNAWRILSLLTFGTIALRTACVREDFQAVLCCWAAPAGFYGRAAGAPYSVWCLGSDINSLKGKFAGRLALRWILRKSRACFADGFAIAADAARISGRPCEFLPTSRRLVFPDASVASAPRKPQTLLYVGRHDPVKGIDLLLEAFAEVSPEFPEVRLVVAGDGPLRSGLEARVRDLNLTQRIEFRGRVPDSDLPALFSRADAVVIPSRSESIPLVMGEAAQAGKTLLVTDVGDMGMLVKRFFLGVVADTPTVPAIASALRGLLRGYPEKVEPQRAEFLRLVSFEESVKKLIAGLSAPSAARNPKNRKWGARALGLVIFGTLIFYGYTQLHGQQKSMLADLKSMDPAWAIGAVLFTSGSFLLSACTWHAAYNSSIPSRPMTFRDSFGIFTLTHLARYLPGSYWNYAIQLAQTLRLGYSARGLLVGNFLNTAWSMTVATALLGIALGIEGAPRPLAWLLLAAAAASTFGAIPAISKILFRSLDIEGAAVRQTAGLLTWLLAWLSAGLGTSCIVFALGKTPIFKHVVVIIGAGAGAAIASAFVPFVPSGFGVRESLMFWVLRPAVGDELALVLPIGSRLAIFLSELLLGVGALALSKFPAKRTGHRGSPET